MKQLKSKFFLLSIQCIFIAIVVWIAHYYYFKSFGFYSDDYYRVGPAINMETRELLIYIRDTFKNFSGQGRPWHPGLIYGLTFLGVKLGNLFNLNSGEIWPVYLIGYIIYLTNTLLFYALLKRISKQPIFAITGALAFALFPADTTQVFLTHSLGIYPSLTFILIAFHLYLSNQKILSYLFVFNTLICYEIFFPLFLVAPLLRKSDDVNPISKKYKEIIQNTIVLMIIFVGVVILRKMTGDDRVASLNILFAIRTCITHMFLGPILSTSMFFYRSIQTLWLFYNKYLLIVVIVALILVWIFNHLKPTISEQSLSFQNRLFNQEIKHLILLGILTLILAYPLTLNKDYSIYEMTDRGSRVHTGAIVGSSILLGCICSYIYVKASFHRKRNFAVFCLILLFTGLITFGITVQQDYALSWHYHQSLFKDVIRLSPDMTEETIILVEREILEDTEHGITYEGGSISYVLENLYQFPGSWARRPSNPPRIYILQPNWQELIIDDEDPSLFQLNRTTTGLAPRYFYKDTKTTNVIFLESKNNQLSRRTDPMIIDENEYYFKPLTSSSTLTNFKKRNFYDYVIKDSSIKLVNYLSKGQTKE